MSSPPSILLLVTSTQRRGGEVFGEQIAKGLGDRGWEASLRSLVRDEGPSVTAQPLVDKPRSELRAIDMAVISALRDVIRAEEPDVVFANGGATLPIAFGASLPSRSGKLVYGSIGEPLYWARTALARRRVGFLMRRCDLVTAISRPTRQQIVRGLGVPEDKVVVAPSGVDESFLEIDARSGSGELRVLFLGSISPEKGPLAALAAFEAAAARAPMTMRFVGGGPALSDLRQRAGPGVDVTGPVGDVRAHLAWADVLLLTSESEGLPGVVLEAGAAGVPTIGYDVGGVSDAVEDGATGRLVKPGDIDALARCLVELAGDAGARERLGVAMRDRVRAQFTLKASVDRYDEVLRALLEGRPIGAH